MTLTADSYTAPGYTAPDYAAPEASYLPLPSPRVTSSSIDDLLRVDHPTGLWWADLAESLDLLADRLWLHCAESDGPDGLHRQILAEQPRLAPEVRRLEREHAELATELRATRILLGRAAGDTGQADLVKTAVRHLLARMHAHEGRSRDALYEALFVDIGGE